MKVRARIIAATPMLCVIIFLILGFCFDLWHPGWIVFFAIPLMPVLLGVKKLSSVVSYPVLCLFIYLAVGIIFKIWHPTWIIFLTIPVFYILFPKKPEIRRIDE